MSNLHKDLVLANIHQFHAFAFANTAARIGATYVTADIGKIVKQTDNNTYWIVKSTVPEFIRLGGGGSAGSFVFYLGAVDQAPEDVDAQGVRSFLLNELDAVNAFAIANVPLTYVAGDQINLKNGVYGIVPTANNVLVRAVTTLIQPGTSQLGSLSDTHTSINAETTVPASSLEVKAIGDIDLTDGSGEINAVAVAPGNILLVKIFRDFGNESVSSVGEARVLRDSFIPSFSA